MSNKGLDSLRSMLRRDGWLLAALLTTVLLCLFLGDTGTANPDPQAQRLSRVLSAMEGAGCVDVAICYEDKDDTIPCSAVVVAEGAGDMAVRLRLSRAVATLLGVDGSRVEVFEREGGSNHGRMDP